MQARGIIFGFVLALTACSTAVAGEPGGRGGRGAGEKR